MRSDVISISAEHIVQFRFVEEYCWNMPIQEIRHIEGSASGDVAMIVTASNTLWRHAVWMYIYRDVTHKCAINIHYDTWLQRVIHNNDV